jgi:glycosyltransferase involved in cell wall biosynthesis
VNLPDLIAYRSEFITKGVPYPLPSIAARQDGLLKVLPSPPEGKTGWPWTVETTPALYNERNSWPKLTIVGPSYNQGNFLEETIRSVLLQNYPNLEYIIIDGGSTDNSRAIIEKYAPWVNYWHSKMDRSHAHALNLGFSLASGDYGAWINSDDYYLPGVFKLVINKFIKTNTDFIYGYAYSITNGRERELIRVPPLLDYFIKIPTLAQAACFWRAAIHQPLWEELNMSVDYELWLRMVKGKKRKRLTQPLAALHVHPEAKTHNPRLKDKWEEDKQKMWAPDGHGAVPEWKRIVFLNRIRMKIYKILGVI